jgi:hypothetical protein
MDDELKSMLDSETNRLVVSNISLFDDWWDQNIEMTSNESTIVSTDLWTRFKQENKNLVNDMNISGDNFKQYIKTKVPLSSIILRSKNANSAFDIKGIKMTELANIVVDDKIEVEFNVEALKPKKIIKKKEQPQNR